MKDNGEKKHRRWPFTLLLPFALVAKAAVSMVRAFRESEDKLLVPGREIPPNAPYHRQRRVVQVTAGIPITATVFVPAGEGPFPGLIMVHSWGWWRMQCDLFYAPMFARRGYVVLTYDCRGWGSSGGQVSCAAPDRELCDLEDLITWMTGPESGIPVDPERIGITGISYGGGHSFLLATRDDRIKAAAPMNGWTDLDQSLMPNRCWKAAWSLLLFAGSMWAVKLNPRNDLVRWLMTVIKDRDLGAVEEELRERSAIHQVGEVKCPMFIVHSWNDDLFEPNQILDFYQKLDVPKKLHMANGLHGSDAGRGDLLVPNRIWDDARRWFDYWLKDDRDNGIADEPAVKYYQPWDKKMAEADAWPPPGIEESVYFVRSEHESTINAGVLVADAPDNHEPADLLVNNTVTSLHSSGLPVFRTNVIKNWPIPGTPFSVPGDSAAFTTEPAEREALLVGAPRVNLFVSSSTSECQVNALLYDVSPKGFCRMVTHSGAMRSDLEPGMAGELDFELIACAHRFAPGHRMRLVLCASDPLFVMPSRVPSYYRLFHTAEHPSSLTVPLMNGGR